MKSLGGGGLDSHRVRGRATRSSTGNFNSREYLRHRTAVTIFTDNQAAITSSAEPGN